MRRNRNTSNGHERAFLPGATRLVGLVAAAGLFAIASFGTQAATQAEPRLYPAPTYPAGSDFVVADFNGDNRADVAFVKPSYDEVRIMISADGAFKKGDDPFPVEDKPMNIVAADFNGDGNSDIAVSNRLADSISVLLGRGDATFDAQVSIAVGNGPRELAASDVDGDGNLDLVVVNYMDNNVATVTGRGDGTFAPAEFASAVTNPVALALADFDDDGKVDIAVGGMSSDGVYILPGDGGSGQTVPGTTSARALAAGDLNSDGKTDLVFLYSVHKQIGVLSGDGAGGFAPPQMYPTMAYDALEVADLDKDGNPDVVAGGGTFKDGVDVWLNDGDGALTATYYPFRTNVIATGSLDVNADGMTDLLLVGAGRLGVLYGIGDGLFESGSRQEAGTFARSVIAADLNGDGATDYVVSNTGDDTLSLLLHGESPSLLPSNSPTGLAAADFNSDGYNDFAVSIDNGTVGVYLGPVTAASSLDASYPVGQWPRTLRVTDINQDGVADLAVAAYGDGTIGMLIGKGDGTFEAATSVAVGVTPKDFIARDLNGDGVVDFAVSNRDAATISILTGDDTGGFNRVAHDVGFHPFNLTAGDFNADGITDLAVDASSALRILLGSSSGAFTKLDIIDLHGGAGGIKSGDINGDGNADVAVATRAGIEMYLGDGTGALRFAGVYDSAGYDPFGFVLRDLNGDGWLDIAAANHGSASFGLTLHRNPAPTLTSLEFEATAGETLSDKLTGAGEFGLKLTYGAADKPQHGAYDIASDGSFTYTSNAGYSGSDSFKVTVDNGYASTTGAVEVDVKKPASSEDDSGDNDDTGKSDDGKADDGDSQDDNDTGNGDTGGGGPVVDPPGFGGGDGGGGGLGGFALVALALFAIVRRKRA